MTLRKKFLWKKPKRGDLIFFHSTYNAGTYVTHVGIYVGDNRMFHAGDPHWLYRPQH
ncbi:C40 family peptidase [Enterococcus faecalis]|uniref:C40 family peptidase n=1 Tax=Enterococcus faecalis TaxID=1351 RepID=A0A974NZF4_ENTFL|nr:C40 family peptidase [Enterococcus faecalis]